MNLRSMGVCAITTALLAAGCGKGDEALVKASEVCTETLTKQADSGMSDDELVAADKRTADKAAEAAQMDDSFAELAKAASNWQQSRENLADLTKRVQDGTATDEEFMQLQNRPDPKPDLVAACRSVKAAGGEFDYSLLDDA